ncbi:MAG: flagellar hook-associated protein FlgL [Syntrophomonadaceae bacterium]|nr:flagellar hook-associated protein FlgL [Syntrophomonadaceae bacterium]
MRVTNKMLTSSLMGNVNNNLNLMQKYENQLSSKVKVDKISDDPVAAAKILKARSELKSQQQYSSNMLYTGGWLRSIDDALADVSDVFVRARTIAVSGSNGATSVESSKALGVEVNSIIDELVHIANTDYNGSYIFAGGESKVVPFTTVSADGNNVTAVKFITNVTANLEKANLQKVEISKGVTIDLAAGQMTFHTDSSGAADINYAFTTLIDLRDHLMNGNQQEVNDLIAKLDRLNDQVISERAVVGAKSNRVEQAQDRVDSFNMSLNNLISTLGDTDYLETSALLSSQRAVYEASLMVGANIIQPSLLKFLK